MRRSRLQLPVIAGAIIGWLIALVPVWNTDRLNLDMLLRIGHHFDRAAQASDVALVLLDQQALLHPDFERSARTYWSRPMATVLQALLDAGASVVGVDVIITRDETVHPDWLLVLRRAGNGGRVVLATADGPIPAVPSSSQRVAAGGITALASANLHPDSDGVIRRMPDTYGELPTLAAALASRSGVTPDGPVLLAPHLVPDIVTWSASDVMAHVGDRRLVEAFAGKAVLIGAWLPDEDRHQGSLGPISGVKLHALAVDAWLHGRGPALPPRPLVQVSILMAASLGALLARRRLWLPALLTLLALPPISVATLMLGIIPPWLSVSVALATAYLVVTAHGLVDAAGRFLSSVPEPFRYHPGSGKVSRVTVCFMDIAAFTQASEHAEPARLASDLGHCLTRLTGVVEKHGGFVDKYLGDGLMALFGASGHDDGSAQALAAARACLSLCEGPGALCIAGHAVRLRIGLASGTARLGQLGATRRMHFTAIGDVVNVAARLEQHNRVLDTQLLADDAVVSSNPDTCWIDHGPQRLRGRKTPVHAWSLAKPI